MRLPCLSFVCGKPLLIECRQSKRNCSFFPLFLIAWPLICLLSCTVMKNSTKKEEKKGTSLSCFCVISLLTHVTQRPKRRKKRARLFLVSALSLSLRTSHNDNVTFLSLRHLSPYVCHTTAPYENSLPGVWYCQKRPLRCQSQTLHYPVDSRPAPVQ